MSMKKCYKVVSRDDCERKQLIVADNYADAVNKLAGMEDFDYLFGEGFVIFPEGEIIV